MSVQYTVKTSVSKDGSVSLTVGKIEGVAGKWNPMLVCEVSLLRYSMMGAIKAYQEMQEVILKKDNPRVASMLKEANEFIAKYEQLPSQKRGKK